VNFCDLIEKSCDQRVAAELEHVRIALISVADSLAGHFGDWGPVRFDLSAYDDVRANAEAICGRLAAGTMPCDGAWPAEDVERFRIWIDNGTPAVALGQAVP
jgi:hypothetical protein